MKLYNTSEVFEINEKLDCDLIKEEWGSYIRVKNFWKNPEKVREVFLNSPCHPLSGACYAIENGIKYFDGRNEICFMDQPQFSNVVFYIICKYFNIDNRFLDLKWKLPTILFGNVFQMYDRNSKGSVAYLALASEILRMADSGTGTKTEEQKQANAGQ